MNGETVLVRRILTIAAVLGGACAVYAGVTAGAGAACSVALGTGVGAGNLWALAQLIRRLFDRNNPNKGSAGVLLGAKMFLLFALVGVLFTRHWISPGWFMVGITTVVFGILGGGLWGALPADPPGDGPPGDGPPGDEGSPHAPGAPTDSDKGND